MPTRFWFLAVVTLSALVVLGSSARAQLAFSFAQNGVATPELTVVEGTAATVQVFLDSIADTRFETRDLFSVGTRVTSDGSFTTFNAITPATIGNGGAFNSSQFNVNTGQLQVLGDGAAPVPFAPTDRILLGSFTFTPTELGSFTLTAEDFNPATSDSIAADANFQNSVVLDSSIAVGTLALTVAPVPEPVSVLALAAAGGLLMRRVGRSRATI